jgi:predicted DNA-binding transcriptional regulator YafY
MFTHQEASALVAATRLAQAWLDPAMAAALEAGWGKIHAVLPAAARAAAESLPLYAPVVVPDLITQRNLLMLREAVVAHRKINVQYCDLAGDTSQRVLWPLGCFYWGAVWTLAAWCEARQDFRVFRVDRITTAEVLDERFAHEAGRTLADFLRTVKKR